MTEISEPTLPDGRPLPAFYNHCFAIYEAMYRKSNTRDDTGTIFTGALTQIFEEVGLGGAYYTSITRRLEAMHCIEQLRRGGGPTPSVWRLHQWPTPEAFANTANVDNSRAARSGRGGGATDQQLRDLHRRVEALEQWARNQGAPI